MEEILDTARQTESLSLICKILGNTVRLHMIILLQKEPRTFGDLLKILAVNPKVLNDNLNTLSKHKLVAKSYPYNLYTLTPAGHVVRQGLAAMGSYVNRITGNIPLDKEA